MNEPWGLSGPQFLEVYGAGMAAVIIIPLLARQVIQRLPGGRRESAAGHLDVYQAAYLAGGRRRVAEVIVAELTQAGALRVSSRGQLSLVDPGLADACPAARAHGVRVDQIPFGDKTHAALKALARDGGVKGIGRELSAAGMVVRPERQRPVLVTAAVLIAALHGAAIARFTEAAANHRPAGDLTGLFILSIVLSVILLIRLREQPWRTHRGAAWLRQASQDAANAPVSVHPAWPGEAGSPGAGGFPAAGQAALLGVALLGFAAVADTELRGALLAGMPSSSSGGGGGACSSGSSCGGGGCGGGGCGG